jgi:hypothetical protein
VKPLLRPLRPMPVFFFLCHKGLRLVVPFAMLGALICNLFLLNRPLYRMLLATQMVFYLLAIGGSIIRLRPKLLMLPYYFSMINAAMFLGAYHASTGLRHMRWK